MELLILKSDNDYIRVKDNRFLRVTIDKASVFPMDQIALVKAHEARLKRSGFASVHINRLILTETEL